MNRTLLGYTSCTMQRKALLFWLSFILLLWLTHALGYLVHEYAHTFTAWALGYKTNPLALDYGHLNLLNLLTLREIDENVDYGSLFAAGKGHFASLIAVSGVLLGSGIFYIVSRVLYSFAKLRNRPILGLFAFLLCLMNVGNFLDYVPIRTFTTHADMANVERGLHISPWFIITVLGFPFAVVIGHFFMKLLPDARGFLFPYGAIPQRVLAVVSSFTVFAFFGSAGMQGYGETSHWLSVLSLCVLFPVVLILCWPRKTEPTASA
ncbi:MAG: hypothetical protein ABSH52_08550 [Terriglobia bacterium]